MRILGIDPGLQRTGYGCVEILDRGTVTLVEGGVVSTDAALTLGERLVELRQGLADVCRELAPNAMAVEDLYSHYNHPRTAVVMGHARGVVLLVAAEHELPLTTYAATRVKKALTGYGRAGKVQMQAAVQSKLRLRTVPEPNDVADALAVALCHVDASRHEIDMTRAAS